MQDFLLYNIYSQIYQNLNLFENWFWDQIFFENKQKIEVIQLE